MVGGSRALTGILSCAVALIVTSCSDNGDSDAAAPPSSSSSTTTTAPPGPELDTDTDAASAARSFIAMETWSEQNPAVAESRFEEWLVPDGPYFQNVQSAIADQLDKGLVSTGAPEILAVETESQSDRSATVLVWLRSDGYRFDGPPEHAFESPPFERTLFIYDLVKEIESWRIHDRRIPQQ